MPTDMKSTPAIGHKRCGCDCKNQTEHEPCEDDPGDGNPPVPRERNVCCEHCPGGAPSAYAVLFECCVLCTGDITHGSHDILAPPIMFLWRDCQFVECTWSGRKFLGAVYAGIAPSNGCGNYWGAPGDQNMPDGVTIANQFPPVFKDESLPEKQQLYYDKLPFKGCFPVPDLYPGQNIDGWYDFYDFPMDAGDARIAWFEQYPLGWKLEVTSPTTATLTGYDTREPYVADQVMVTYECDDFDCLGRSTFNMVGDWPEWHDDVKCWALPKHVCVVPAVSQYRTPCESPSAACECRDAGHSEARLTFGDNECLGVTELMLPRNVELPACVPDPGGPCGYFYAELTTTTGRKLGFLLWCAGTAPWNLKVYCFNALGTDCTEVCDNSPTTEVRYCPYEEFTWFCDDVGECCGTGVDVECCEDDIPDTLYATLSAGSCATLNGTVITLTYVGIVGGWHQWTGTFTPSHPGSCPTPFTFYFEILDGIACEFQAYIKSSAGVTIWGDDTDSGSALSCPFVSVTTGTVGQNLGACIVSIMPPLCSGTMSATISV